MKLYTDYPFHFLGDQEYKPAPIREIKLASYDGDKYCKIIVEDRITDIKSGYIYTAPCRLDEALEKKQCVRRVYLETFIMKPK